MKALTVLQPWASLIATGAKRIETRSWSTRHRGSLAIHAGGVLDEELLLALCPQLEFAAGLAGALPPFRPGERPLVEALPYGAIVAIADLRDVRPTEGFGEELDRPRWLGPDHTGVAFTERAFGDFRARRFGWVLGGVRPLPEPIVARGRQGLWEWTPPASFDLGALPLLGAARASRPPEPQVSASRIAPSSRSLYCGKSTAIVVLVEEIARAGGRAVVADPTGVWWGLAHPGSGPGLPAIILGGEHGDVPLEETGGQLVADVVRTSAHPVTVLDLKLLRKGQQVRFLADFCEALYHGNRDALHFVIDEAGRFAPQQLREQGHAPRLLGAIEDIVKLGRSRGLGCSLIEQRPAHIAKSVFEQIETLIAFRLMGPNDRKAIRGWIEAQGEPERERELGFVDYPSRGAVVAKDVLFVGARP